MNTCTIPTPAAPAVSTAFTDLPGGVWPVAITPFTAAGTIDWEGYDRLLDWYEQRGASGLFAVCLSSEFFELTPEECAGLARRAVQRYAGRLPVVAGGGLGDNLPTAIDSVKRIADTGVRAVIIPVNQLLRADEDAGLLETRLATVLEQTGSIRLGLYECPHPYRRGLSPEQLGACARTGRIDFFKDTCCNAAEIGRKVAAATETPLQVYNANLTTLLATLDLGCRGYDGPAANLYPDLIDRMMELRHDDPVRTGRLSDLVMTGQRVLCWKYLRTVKNFLKLEGLPLTDYSRMECPELDWEDHEYLRAFHRLVTQQRRELL